MNNVEGLLMRQLYRTNEGSESGKISCGGLILTSLFVAGLVGGLGGVALYGARQVEDARSNDQPKAPDIRVTDIAESTLDVRTITYDPQSFLLQLTNNPYGGEIHLGYPIHTLAGTLIVPQSESQFFIKTHDSNTIRAVEIAGEFKYTEWQQIGNTLFHIGYSSPQSNADSVSITTVDTTNGGSKIYEFDLTNLFGIEKMRLAHSYIHNGELYIAIFDEEGSRLLYYVFKNGKLTSEGGLQNVTKGNQYYDNLTSSQVIDTLQYTSVDMTSSLTIDPTNHDFVIIPSINSGVGVSGTTKSGILIPFGVSELPSAVYATPLLHITPPPDVDNQDRVSRFVILANIESHFQIQLRHGTTTNPQEIFELYDTNIDIWKNPPLTVLYNNKLYLIYTLAGTSSAENESKNPAIIEFDLDPNSPNRLRQFTLEQRYPELQGQRIRSMSVQGENLVIVYSKKSEPTSTSTVTQISIPLIDIIQGFPASNQANIGGTVINYPSEEQVRSATNFG